MGIYMTQLHWKCLELHFTVERQSCRRLDERAEPHQQ